MARRNQHKKGLWLCSDDYTGFTRYSGEMQKDYWGNFTKRPMLRNLQEIASPLSDPEPVPFFRGSLYETIASGACESQLYIGNTAITTPASYAAQVLGFAIYDANTDGIGTMSIGNTFRVF